VDRCRSAQPCRVLARNRAAVAARRSARVLLNLEADDCPKESTPTAQSDDHLPVGKGEFVNGLSRGKEVEAADESAQPFDVGAFNELRDLKPRIEVAHGSPEDTRRALRWRELLARAQRASLGCPSADLDRIVIATANAVASTARDISIYDLEISALDRECGSVIRN